MKIYIKIIFAVIVLAGLFAFLSDKTAKPFNYGDKPAKLLSNDKETMSENPQVNSDIVVSVEGKGKIFSNAYPNEMAMCENVTWIKDVDESESGYEISQLTALKEAQIQASANMQKAEVLANAKSLGELGNYISLQDPRVNKVERMEDYKKKWFPWKYFSGPSIDNNSYKRGIYLSKNIVCSNATWKKDSEGETETINEISTTNVQNIMAQYNVTELLNGTVFYSLDGTRYVRGPSKNGEYGYGIYFKK